MTDRPGRDDAGHDEPDLVAETRRVASAVQEWLRSTADQAGVAADGWTAEAVARTAAEAAGRTAAEAAERTAADRQEGGSTHTGSDCDWCPICQFAAALRADHPELVARIGEAASAMAGALRALVDTALSHADDPRPAPRPARPAGRRPRPYPSPGGGA